MPTNPTTQTYNELQAAFDYFNRVLFDDTIPRCLITLQREKRTYGYASFKRFIHRNDETLVDEIAMNPAYFAVIPLLEILQTLVHEMVHIWQFHYGKAGRRGYHNKEWANKMESIGLMPSSTGEPGGAKTGEKVADYPIEGGAFLQAAQHFMEQGHGISWLDRYAARPPQNYDGFSSTSSNSHQLTAAPPPHSGIPAAVSSTEAVFIYPAENRSNRAKYRCPECGIQAWGKPNLKLLCGGEKCKAAPLVTVTEA